MSWVPLLRSVLTFSSLSVCLSVCVFYSTTGCPPSPPPLAANNPSRSHSVCHAGLCLKEQTPVSHRGTSR